MTLQYFGIIMYIWWLLKILFFVWKAYQTVPPWQNFATGQPAKPDKYYHKKIQNFNKTAACSHHCPFWHEHHHWYTEYTFDLPSRVSNPTTYLGLCFPGDYRQSIESSMAVPTFHSTEKAHKFTIYDCILRLRQKSVIFDEIYPFDCRDYLSGDISWMRWAD